MTRCLVAATALAAVAFAQPAAAQVRTVNPQPGPVQPVAPMVPAPHQPTMLELQGKIEALTEQVAALTERLTALNQHIATMSGDLGALNARERTHYAQLQATSYQDCRLLYQHVWAGVSGHAFLPDDYCMAAGWRDAFAE